MFYKMSVREGYKSETYDAAHSPSQNIITECGFYGVVNIALRLVENGVALADPKCSLWVQFLSKGVHKRENSNVEGAWEKRRCVFEANLINENTAVIVAILHSRKVHIGLENPSGSWYFLYPTMASLTALLGFYEATTWMINFGHWMPKPTKLVGSLLRFGLENCVE